MDWISSRVCRIVNFIFKILGRFRGKLANNFIYSCVNEVIMVSTNRENWNTHVMPVALTAKGYQVSPTKLQFCKEKGGCLGDFLAFLSGKCRKVPDD